MSTPGIGDPYWYEWYVGLERVIEMINSDSNISYVTFQSDIHNTIDDVVVGIGNEEEICYQVKHEVGDVGRGNLTFSKLVDSTKKNGSAKVSLLKALAIGWEEAARIKRKAITPVLYTNRKLGANKTTRVYEGQSYTAVPLEHFLKEIKSVIEQSESILEVDKLISNRDLKLQWNEFKNSIDDDSLIFRFYKRTRN